MNVNLNNLLTLSAQARESNHFITGITGLGISDIRTSSFVFSGRDGGLITDQFFDLRNINITGKIGSNDNNTKAQHQADRAALVAALPVGSTFPVYFTLFDGSTYVIYCNLIKLTMDYTSGGLRSDFLIQLSAGDPLFYSTDGGDTHTAHVTRVAQGGYVTPYILPVSWDSGSSPTIVVNSGDSLVYPVITLNDAAINPSITNQATDETFELTLTMVAGDELIIDMGARTVTLNGASVMGNKTDASIWWGLQPGNNPIVLDSDSAGDTVTADVVWRNGVRGI
jgi:hypothetical protein